MKFLEYKECIAVSRSRDNRLYCLKIKSGKKNRLTVTATRIVDIGDSFVNAMTELLKQIRPEEHQLIIYGGDMPGAVCSEFLIPQLSSGDILPAISYELSRFLPHDISESVTGYRIIDNNVSGKMRVRSLTISSQEWTEQLNDLRNSGVKIDAFIHPFLAVDPVLSEVENICIHHIEPEFQLSFSQTENIRKITVPESQADRESAERDTKEAVFKLIDLEKSSFTSDDRLDEFVPALIIGTYGLCSNFENDRPNLLPIPKGMFPERFRWLRIIFFLLISTAVIFLTGLFGRNIYENNLRLESLKSEIKKTDSKITDIKKDAVANKKFNEMIDKIKEVEPEIGNHEILLSLHELNKYVPPDMWVTNFNFRKDSFEATIVGKSGAKDDMDLSKSILFSKAEKNKRLQPDQSLSIYLKMHYVSPSERNRKAEDE